jgi:hypothetical protein
VKWQIAERAKGGLSVQRWRKLSDFPGSLKEAQVESDGG